MTPTPELRIDRTIEIKAPPDRVFRALSDPAQVGAWFQVTIEGEMRPGNSIWMTLTMPGKHHGMRFEVLIAEMTPPRRVVWLWHPGAVDESLDYSKEPRTTVTFTIEPIQSGTRLTVSETGFNELTAARRAQAFKDNSQGWDEVVVWIQKYAETQG